jgi:hypothetical protein
VRHFDGSMLQGGHGSTPTRPETFTFLGFVVNDTSHLGLAPIPGWRCCPWTPSLALSATTARRTTTTPAAHVRPAG